MPANLVIGPLLRYAGETDATVWIETDAACEVEILGAKCRTFEIESHHYALTHVEGLEPGEDYPYEVLLDGEQVWPSSEEEFAEFPPSCIRTTSPEREGLNVAFGSCRVSLPHEKPYTQAADTDEGHEVDAIYALAKRMQEGKEAPPDILLLLGDQVYADEGALDTREWIKARRDTSVPPGDEIADFEEYTHLYQESWSHPVTRWLLSTLPSAMIFDDHDVRDDWNISIDWLEEMRATTWWNDRVVGAFMSYWIYQHLGNLPPDQLAEDEMWEKVRAHDGDAGPMLRDFAFKADRQNDGTRWSFYRDLGRTRVLMVDSRAGRCLNPGERDMLDPEEWEWVEEHATGDFDHLLIGSSLPVLLGRGMHELEAWNEATADGAWGERFKPIAEKIRQEGDLEHWAAFQTSFRRMRDLLLDVATGKDGSKPPATVVMLSGDVHHAYLADVAFKRGSGAQSAVYQAVCSPFRNPLSSREQMAIEFGISKAGAVIGRAFARSAGVADPGIRWRFLCGPTFDNQVATLAIEGREMTMRLERTSPDDDVAGLTESFTHRLA
ncbi:MAG: alkaline phosphatase family protein [Thermoleophilaceae bacterium]|nr:alkaline phosphatase family protein [Thermoleophilaceae bacterium]